MQLSGDWMITSKRKRCLHADTLASAKQHSRAEPSIYGGVKEHDSIRPPDFHGISKVRYWPDGVP